MGNCCSEDLTPYEPELGIEQNGPGLEVKTLGSTTLTVPPMYDDSLSAAPESPPENFTDSGQSKVSSAAELPSSQLSDIANPNTNDSPKPETSEKPLDATHTGATSVEANNSSMAPEEDLEIKQKPGAKIEEDLESLSPAETKLTGDVGCALVYTPIAGGTLTAKWVASGKPAGTVAFLRIRGEVDDLKLNNQPFQCGRNLKTDWMLLAKAICVFLKQCWAHQGELELLPQFNTILPRRAVLVMHKIDLTMETFSAPAAIETMNPLYDACAVMPHLSETFKGQGSLKISTFLEKAVRRGATLRF